MLLAVYNGVTHGKIHPQLLQFHPIWRNLEQDRAVSRQRATVMCPPSFDVDRPSKEKKLQHFPLG